jgi:hypothetical protein
MRAVLADKSVFIALAAAALLCILSLTRPSLLLTETPYDIYVPLDAGVRWLNGFLPSIDYPSSLGILYATIHGVMLWINPADARSIVHADVAALAVIAALLWPVLRGLPALWQSAVYLLVAGLILSPLDLDKISTGYRYIADYNRWSWGLHAVVLVWSLNRTARGKAAQLAVSLALCLMLLLKLSMFVGAVMTLGLALFNRRGLRDYVTPACLLVGVVLIGCLTGYFIPYLRDNMAAAQATASLRLGRLYWQVPYLYNLLPSLIVLVFCCVDLLPARSRWLLGANTGILYFVSLQNFDFVIPTIGLPLLLLAWEIDRAKRTTLRALLMEAPAIVQGGGLFVVALLALLRQQDVAAQVNALPIAPPGQIGNTIHVATIPTFGVWNGGGDLPFANDVIYAHIKNAQELLTALPDGTSVATLETANIAVAAWPRLRPAPHPLLWYDYRRSYSLEVHPAAARIFADADVILVPRHFTTENIRRLVALYQDWLDRCATPIAANAYWRLYRPIGADKALVPTTCLTTPPCAGQVDCRQ